MAISTLGFGFQGGGSGGGGAQGPAGTNGSVWRNNDGVPSNSLGANGDYYLNNENGDVFLKVGGAYVPTANIKGSNGTNGTNGSVWYAGNGVPSPSPSYNATDFFLDNDTGDVYQYNGSSWGVPVTNIFGTDGTDGSVWYSGAGSTPPVGTYNTNDLYLDTDTNELYQYDGTSSTWNPITNIQGANGSQWYTGSGVPITITNDGDFYLNADDGEVWEIVLGSWQDTLTNIKGANGTSGTDGSVWYTDVVYPPPAGTYLPTDFYLNSTNGNVYQLQNDGITWVFQLSIVGTGIAGSVWYNGNANPVGLQTNGDYFLNNLTGDVFQQVGGSWGTAIANIKGANGTNGTNGTDGSTWFNGNGVPDNGTGIDGDYYLDNLTGDVYLKVSGNWGSPVANIKGVQGDAGADGVSSSFFFYRTNTGVTSGSPTNQKVRWNQTAQITSTELGISTLTDDSVDITIFLALLNAGDTIIIQDKNASANYQTWLVNNTITDNGTWFSVPVTFVNSGGNGTTNFADNHPSIIAISREGAAGIDAANSQRYNYDSNVGGVPQAYSFTANDTTYVGSTQFRFDFFNQGQTDVTAWWDALYQNWLINPNNNFLQIRGIANQEKLGSYLIQEVAMVTTYALVKIDAVLSSNGSLNAAVSVSYSLSAADGGVGANGSNGANNVSWSFSASSSTPANERFACSNPTDLASLQTFFEFNINGVAGQNQSAWLQGAKDISDAGSLGYLQVTKDGNSINSAVYEINSITQDLVNSTWTFNVSFYGGFDYNFNLYTIPDQFNFAYVFNGSGGGTPLIIKDENANVDLDTTTINFTGAGVSATQTSAGVVEVAIAGGSGGDGGIVSSIRSLSTSTTLSPFVVGVLTMPYDGEITGWTIFSDVAGGCDVRYYVGTFAAYPPTTPLFTGLNPNPTLTAEISNDASGLSVAVTKGQVIQCELFAVSGSMARIDVTLQITKT